MIEFIKTLCKYNVLLTYVCLAVITATISFMIHKLKQLIPVSEQRKTICIRAISMNIKLLLFIESINILLEIGKYL